MKTIKFLILALATFAFCNCENDGTSKPSTEPNNQAQPEAEPNEFEKKLIQRSESHESDAEQIRNRINASTDAANPKGSSAE